MVKPNELWGTELSLDLGGCDPAVIRDPVELERIVRTLCGGIGVKPYGPCQIVGFGSSPRVAGFSLVQLIDESLISGHFVDSTGSAYINVFSCRDFDPRAVANYLEQQLGAKSSRAVVNYRAI